MTVALDFDIEALGGVLGAQVLGADLTGPLDEATVHRLRAALNEFHLLVFRDQALSGEQQVNFSASFGELEGHVVRRHDGSRTPTLHVVSNLDANGQPTGTPRSRGNFHWHTDKSYHEVPSYATLLHARQIPPAGGNTEFASMHLAYEALPAARQQALADLRLVHSWEASRINSGSHLASEEEKRERPPVVHPLVRTHPDTQRKLLYMGTHVSHIEGQPQAQGKALVDELMAHATQSQFVYAHEWSDGDLVMWDNRSLMHRAIQDFDASVHPRVLHRTVVRGTRPY
jgi:taurine dioxygenase